MPKDRDNIKNNKDISTDFNDNGEIDLSKDIEDIELSLNGDSASEPLDELKDLDTGDIDELDADLNLEDEIQLDETPGLSDSFDLDSTSDINEASGTELDLNGEDNLELDLENDDFNFDDSEEYGVDLKSDPETIDTFSFDSEEHEDLNLQTLDKISDISDEEISFHDELNLDNTDLELPELSKEEEDLQGLVTDIENELEESKDISLDETISAFSDKEIDSLPDLDISEEELKDDFIEELPDISEEKLSLEQEEKKEPSLEDNLESLDLDSLEEEPLQEVDSLELDKAVSEEKEGLADISSLESDEIKLDNFDINDELGEEPLLDIETEGETLNSDIPDITIDDLTLSLDEVKDEDLNAEDTFPDVKNEDLDVGVEELKGMISEESEKLSGIEDISPEELDIDLSDNNEIESINLGNAKPYPDNDKMDFSAVNNQNVLKSKIEDIDTLEPAEDFTLEYDKTGIEENIFPEDDKLPALDEDITALDIDGSEELENSISPLKDAENILSNSSFEGVEESGSLNDIDLDNIPEQKSEDIDFEEESIGLSLDELENVSKNTSLTGKTAEDISLDDDEKIKDPTILEELNIEPIDISGLEEKSADVKEENATIDLSTFDADLKEVDMSSFDIAEDKDVYADLNEKMKEKKVSDKSSSDVDSLKNNVKDVLTYLDQLLDALPEEKIKEFAESKAFEKYKKLFKELKIK